MITSHECKPNITNFLMLLIATHFIYGMNRASDFRRKSYFIIFKLFFLRIERSLDRRIKISYEIPYEFEENILLIRLQLCVNYRALCATCIHRVYNLYF